MGSIQRGARIAKNDNGTLERVDGTSTYIGSATLPNGKVITHKFRSASRNDKEVTERWLKWQNDQKYEEEKMANTKTAKTNETAAAKKAAVNGTCPLQGGCECSPTCMMWSAPHRACSLMMGGIALFNMCVNIANLNANESLELIALAIGDLKAPATEQRPADAPTVKSVPTERDGIDAYLDGKSFLSFVNIHSKKAFFEYGKFCKENGYPAMSEREMVAAIGKRFPEIKCEGKRGGTVFIAA